MRLVTWNCCRGAYHKKVPLLDALAPDIAVVQECAKPTDLSNQCLWFGDNPRQGVAVHAYGDYQLCKLPLVEGVPRYFIPIKVSGPINFVLVAVWAQRDPPFPYVEGVIRATDLYRDLFREHHVVVAGDFNSNSIWDSKHRTGLCHSALVTNLLELGLESAYHAFHGEAHGNESQPTYYFRWNQKHPYHIDYCFIPSKWVPTLHRVEVGSFEGWMKYSDHRPLLIEFAESAKSTEA